MISDFFGLEKFLAEKVRQKAESDSDQRTDQHVGEIMRAEKNPRKRDQKSDRISQKTQFFLIEGDSRGRVERRKRMPGRKRVSFRKGIVNRNHEILERGAECLMIEIRPRPVNQKFQAVVVEEPSDQKKKTGEEKDDRAFLLSGNDDDEKKDQNQNPDNARFADQRKEFHRLIDEIVSVKFQHPAGDRFVDFLEKHFSILVACWFFFRFFFLAADEIFEEISGDDADEENDDA